MFRLSFWGPPLNAVLSLSSAPLIQSLSNRDRWVKLWYADDFSCVAALPALKDWFNLLSNKGPNYGNFPESTKSVLVVNSQHQVESQSLFEGLGIKVVSNHRFLGGYMGDCQGMEEFVGSKVQTWLRCIQRLSWAAESQPQAALAALSRSVQFEWSYLQRVVPDCTDRFSPIHDVLQELFWPSLLSGSVSESEDLFCLPPHKVSRNGY